MTDPIPTAKVDDADRERIAAGLLMLVDPADALEAAIARIDYLEKRNDELQEDVARLTSDLGQARQTISALTSSRARHLGERNDARAEVDAFAVLRVMPSDLARYLGHDVGTPSPAEVDDLRAVYTAINTGETTWTAIMADRGAGEERKDATSDKLKAKLAPKSAPKAKPIEWEISDGGLVTVRGALAGKIASVEQTGPSEWSWWVHVDVSGGEELASGTEPTLEAARAAAIKAAS